ncbi:hypothetical protein BC829DRAFT_26597 [Chytridium lagenaria]|nr:hypothetical protein BC829DRAFT_26597 [Chytridium lagenaria]
MLEASESRKQSVTTTQANTNEIGAGLTKIDSMISLKNSIKASRLSLNPSQILRSPVFWMYTTAFTFQQGLTYITNLSSIVAAVDGTPGSSLDNLVALHITVTSVFQSAGRLLTGVIVDLPMFTSKRYDRSILFFYAMIFLTLPHLIVGYWGLLER